MVSLRLSGALLAAAAPCLVVPGTPGNASSKLMVHVPRLVPHKLFKEDGYDQPDALFGRPPYGGSISQPVDYTEDDPCDMSKPVLNAHPKDVNEKGEVILKPPIIMMLNRGNCAFVQIARNSQRNGTAGVVIADNVCLCTDSECMSQQQQNRESSPPCETDGR